MSRFVHGRASARPSIGGTAGDVPTLSTTPRAATNVSSPTRHPSDAVEHAGATHEAHALADQAVDGDLVVPVVGGFVADAVGDEARSRARPWPVPAS